MDTCGLALGSISQGGRCDRCSRAQPEPRHEVETEAGPSERVGLTSRWPLPLCRVSTLCPESLGGGRGRTGHGNTYGVQGLAGVPLGGGAIPSWTGRTVRRGHGGKGSHLQLGCGPPGPPGTGRPWREACWHCPFRWGTGAQRLCRGELNFLPSSHPRPPRAWATCALSARDSGCHPALR